MVADKETLIHAIELRVRIAKRNHQGFVDFPYELVGNVLDLLKEQEGKYYSEVFDVGYKAGRESIARCKDCKYWKDEAERNDHPSWLPCMDVPTRDNFFCADGVSKDE